MSVVICQSYYLRLGLTHLTENRSIVLSYFLLKPTADVVVRMAERSKAPDSRFVIPSHFAMGAGVLVSEWRRGFESHS